jgi:hypothetical protein
LANCSCDIELEIVEMSLLKSGTVLRSFYARLSEVQSLPEDILKSQLFWIIIVHNHAKVIHMYYSGSQPILSF